MSKKYKHGDEVPNDVLANRLEELSNEITKGNLSQFVMRVPAELDYCPDLVMSTAARRLKELEAKDKLLSEVKLTIDSFYTDDGVSIISAFQKIKKLVETV